MKLSIIIPVFNERRWLEPLCQGLKRAPLDRCPEVRAVELIFVDDGSSDGSAEALRALEQKPFAFACGLKADVSVHALEKNQGKTAAVRLGIGHSTGDLIILQDADLEYSPQDYPNLLAPVVSGIADAVFGSRFAGYPRRVLFFWHSLANHLITALSNMINDLNLTDVAAGYKVIRGDLLRELKLSSSRFGLEIELASRLARSGARIYEVPIQYQGRTYEEGKKIRAKDGVRAVFQIFGLALFDRIPFVPGMKRNLWALMPVAKKIYGPLVERAFSKVGRNTNWPRILEIGAGMGTTTQLLVHRGELVATDVDARLVRSLQDRIGCMGQLDARVWNSTQAPWTGAGTFDVVVALNVLEHIEDDLAALRNWRALVRPGGSLLLMVPMYPFLFSPLDESLGHFRRYSWRELENRLKAAGYRVRTKRFGNPLGILGWLFYGGILRQRHLGTGMYSAYLISRALLLPIDLCLRPFVGLEVMVVCDVAEPQEKSREKGAHAA